MNMTFGATNVSVSGMDKGNRKIFQINKNAQTNHLPCMRIGKKSREKKEGKKIKGEVAAFSFVT